MEDGFPVLKTDRFLLRQFTTCDVGNVFNGLSHPDVIKYYGIRFDTLEATQEQITWYASLQRTGTGIWWAICSLDNLTFYGAGGLNNLDSNNRKAEIGFWLLPSFWGQGIMKEVFPLICAYGFDKLGLHRVEGLVESENRNCKRAMAKLDFKYEGTMTDCEIKNGTFISLDIYAKLSDH